MKFFSEIGGPPPTRLPWEPGNPISEGQEARDKSQVRVEPTLASSDWGAWDWGGEEAEASQASLALPGWCQRTDSAYSVLILEAFFDLWRMREEPLV